MGNSYFSNTNYYKNKYKIDSPEIINDFYSQGDKWEPIISNKQDNNYINNINLYKIDKLWVSKKFYITADYSNNKISFINKEKLNDIKTRLIITVIKDICLIEEFLVIATNENSLIYIDLENDFIVSNKLLEEKIDIISLISYKELLVIKSETFLYIYNKNLNLIEIFLIQLNQNIDIQKSIIYNYYLYYTNNNEICCLDLLNKSIPIKNIINNEEILYISNYNHYLIIYDIKNYINIYNLKIKKFLKYFYCSTFQFSNIFKFYDNTLIIVNSGILSIFNFNIIDNIDYNIHDNLKNSNDNHNKHDNLKNSNNIYNNHNQYIDAKQIEIINKELTEWDNKLLINQNDNQSLFNVLKNDIDENYKHIKNLEIIFKNFKTNYKFDQTILKEGINNKLLTKHNLLNDKYENLQNNFYDICNDIHTLNKKNKIYNIKLENCLDKSTFKEKYKIIHNGYLETKKNYTEISKYFTKEKNSNKEIIDSINENYNNISYINEELDSLTEKINIINLSLNKNTTQINPNNIESFNNKNNNINVNQLKKQIKIEIVSELKHQLKQELKGEIKKQLKKELKKELRNDIKNELKKELMSELNDEFNFGEHNELKEDIKFLKIDNLSFLQKVKELENYWKNLSKYNTESFTNIKKDINNLKNNLKDNTNESIINSRYDNDNSISIRQNTFVNSYLNKGQKYIFLDINKY